MIYLGVTHWMAPRLWRYEIQIIINFASSYFRSITVLMPLKYETLPLVHLIQPLPGLSKR